MTLETVLSLWPDGPPGAEAVTVVEREDPRVPGSPPGDSASVLVTRPTLWHFRAGEPSGASLLVVPGGGYHRVVTGFGVRSMCAWFTARGIDVFVLRYRLPGDGWAAGPNAPLQDARRAQCLIHSNAVGWGLDPGRVGVLGMSAGGHLATALAMGRGTGSYTPLDAADAISASVPLLGLLYPVVTMGDHAHAGSRTHLLGPLPDAQAIAAHSLERHVTGAIPPTFLATALDDDVVDPANTLLLHDALRASRIPVELHLFERGGHGFTLQSHVGARVAWPEAFLHWATARWQQG